MRVISKAGYDFETVALDRKKFRNPRVGDEYDLDILGDGKRYCLCVHVNSTEVFLHVYGYDAPHF
jgi:hypothetical protein